ncbi:MAG: ribosomal protein S18-alanine N-acetyltransferase [Desulfuromonadaceae bacterium]|nr:ribosomal protein S18-alanine N-acetyltransferase [Geobacteraceae bacterium]
MGHTKVKPSILGGQIGFATAADVPELVHLEQQCYAQAWSESRFAQECANPRSYILLLREKGVIQAYLCFWHLGPEVEIHSVACTPNRRRSGAAQALLEYLCDWSRAQHVEQMFLEVRRSNEGAIKLYQKFGLTICGRRAGYYSNGEDALLMYCMVTQR